MRVSFVCGRERDYPRNISAVVSLQRNAEVSVLAPERGRLSANLVAMALRILATAPAADCNVVGFYGQPLVFPARLRWGRPIVFDAFVSTYDTYCFDRKIFRPDSLPGRLAFHLDRLSCAWADCVLVDTHAHAAYFHRTFGVPMHKLKVVYVGCDETHFRPLPHIQPDPEPLVLFYGTFLPLHGVDVIVDAAQQLRDTNVRFKIIGRGQNYGAIRERVAALGLQSVAFVDAVPYARLPEEIARATICLGGHFGRSDKAARVIAAKSFQCMAAGRPTILGDNAANRELFVHGQHAWMVPMGDPAALAQGIRVLLADADLRARLGAQGRERASASGGNDAVAQAFQAAVDYAVGLRGQRASSSS